MPSLTARLRAAFLRWLDYSPRVGVPASPPERISGGARTIETTGTVTDHEGSEPCKSESERPYVG
jgi:hypothetical protein